MHGPGNCARSAQGTLRLSAETRQEEGYSCQGLHRYQPGIELCRQQKDDQRESKQRNHLTQNREI